MALPCTELVFRRTAEELKAKLLFVNSLEDVVATYESLYPELGEAGRRTALLECLQGALAALDSEEVDVGRLFSAILRWAVDGQEIFPSEVQVWKHGEGPREVAYSAAQCRALLANAMLLNVCDTCAAWKDEHHLGGLSFAKLLLNTNVVTMHRVACLLSYFQTQLATEGTEADRRRVVWQRRGSPQAGATAAARLAAGKKAAVAAAEDREREEAEALAATAQKFYQEVCQGEGGGRVCDPSTGGSDGISLHTGTMESVEGADAFVNFANRIFGCGHFIASCAQEGITQVCCPELNVGMLHHGRLLDSEVVVTKNLVRFSAYTGFGNTFRYEKPWTGEPRTQTILTMDAARKEHFTREKNLRDIRKAYLCFQGCAFVSTGRWGCGAFGGLPVHKFLQQIVAASLAGCRLKLSTFGSPDEACDRALKLLSATKPTAAELLEALLKTCGSESEAPSTKKADSFLKTLEANLQQQQRSQA